MPGALLLSVIDLKRKQLRNEREKVFARLIKSNGYE